MSDSRLVLIDGSGYFYRAFFAIRFLANSRGLPTNAVYGFTRMLLKVVKQQQPDYLAVAFDVKAPTFRHRQFADYKASRPPMPENLSRQIPYIKRVLDALNIACLELPGYEADDIIGTVARRAVRRNIDTLVISGDKDMWQLVNERVKVFDEIRGKVYDETQVQAALGVSPAQVVDVMALVGDSSDNVPGVPGIGLKTAVKLIGQFQTLENLLANLSQVGSRAQRGKLEHYAEQARLSRRLVSIDSEAPLELDWEKLRRRVPDYAETSRLFKELEFFTLLKELSTDSLARPQVKHEIILQPRQLRELLRQLEAASRFAFSLYLQPRQAMRGELVGIGLCCRPGQGYYIPLGHDYAAAPRQLPRDEVLAALKPFWEDASLPKSTPEAKFAHLVLARHGVGLEGVDFDPGLAAYLLYAGRNKYELGELALEYLNRRLDSYQDLAGKGSKEVAFGQLPLAEAGPYAAESCEVLYLLREKMLARLAREGMSEIFADMELPLSEVLAQMELAGVRLDVEFLKEISRCLETELETISERIHFFSGEKFNFDSPQQLARVLFERLGLPTFKRTKTGYSTNMEVLRQLALFHPLPGEILEYRKLKKLKSTYVDALPALLNPETGRLHTSFNQMVTATGRLSSSDPNLQNIPIRGEWGTRIRRAFVPAEGCCLLSADYSQVELRLLAHLAGDENLLESFLKDEDVHERTAREIFRLPAGQIKPQLRRRAKAINFGIVYGMSAYGLAKEINVGQKEAQEYIENYFARYPQVKVFIRETINKARRDGYTSTLFGRRRYLPQLQAKDRPTRQFGERMAINAPIQGTAADIIKLAMIDLYREFRRRDLESRLLLQVHDELLFEVPEGEVDLVSALVKKRMEEVVKLAVPLKVQVRIGDSWAKTDY